MTTPNFALPPLELPMPARLASWKLTLVCWFPHSGGRWLNRGLLSGNPAIHLSEYFTPWLNQSVDAILDLDRTAQVHKSRSLAPLRGEFDMVTRSVEAARRAGLIQYFLDKSHAAERDAPGKLALGALPVGTHVGLPDFALLRDILPELRIIQLMRDPVGCFASLKSRREMDGDPVRVAASWVALNATMRQFFADPFQAPYHRVVRLEDLTGDLEGTLRGLCDWLGAPFDPAMLEAREQYHGRNRDQDPGAAVTAAEAAMIRQITGTEAAAYGYAG